MEGWRAIRLEEAADAVSTGPFGSILHKKDYVEDGTPLINPANIVDGAIIPDRTKTVNLSAMQRLASYVLSENDVIVGRRGEIGRCAVIRKQHSGWICGTGSFFVRPSPKLDPYFLCYLLRSPRVRDQLERASTGATMNNLSNRALRKLILFVPSLVEQRHIVGILDAAFEGVDTAIANAELNLANVRALFESTVKSVFDERQSEWAPRTLRDVCLDYGRGKSKHRPRNDPRLFGGAYPFIQTGDIRNADHFIQNHTQRYNDIGLAQSKMWPRGTVCITIAANIAESGILSFDACFPDSVIGLVVDEERASNEFVEYMIQSVKARIKAKGRGSAQDNINLGTFKDELFYFPGVGEQRKIVDRLNDVSADVKRLQATYQSKLDALSELKQSLLRKAFTGGMTMASDAASNEAVAVAAE
jgi:type I restriction enzyme, S subunit